MISVNCSALTTLMAVRPGAELSQLIGGRRFTSRIGAPGNAPRSAAGNAIVSPIASTPVLGNVFVTRSMPPHLKFR
jgi:hypothetical protein